MADTELSNGFSQYVKLISITRIVIYLYVVWVQLLQFLIAPFVVLVPLFLAIVDSALIYWSNNDSRLFWNSLPFASLLATLVSANSIINTINVESWTAPDVILFGLGCIVIALSMVELAYWIDRNNSIMKDLQHSTTSEIRTYDS